ncbi:hypothetical protein M3625_21150 [Paenibacillus sp. MER 78]|nr:hypothetical protein [Paenibacillus sp. MER 78]
MGSSPSKSLNQIWIRRDSVVASSAALPADATPPERVISTKASHFGLANQPKVGYLLAPLVEKSP